MGVSINGGVHGGYLQSSSTLVAFPMINHPAIGVPSIFNGNQVFHIHPIINRCYWIPVVPHKAVAEVSKIGNL